MRDSDGVTKRVKKVVAYGVPSIYAMGVFLLLLLIGGIITSYCLN